ncbi:DUF1273 domain-containing protein [Oscillospiraceae bacterium OttesenSCG-928-G22]|nr:DUF1273 domain-containing protein [Oscillospiraceae bacterium OttesenSCG-928-G22]
MFGVEKHKLRLAVLSVMEEAVRQHNIKKFLTAVNPGVEMLAVECANALNVFYPGITVEAVVPYEEQHVVWNIEEQERYFELHAACSSVEQLEAMDESESVATLHRHYAEFAEHIFFLWASGKQADTFQWNASAEELTIHTYLWDEERFRKR